MEPSTSPIRLRLAVLLLVLGTGAAGGCSDAASESRGDDLSGVPVHELREQFRLGGMERPEQETFQREPQLAVDGQQFLYVLHQDMGQVAVFDPDGVFVRWIRGGRGEGPGEFTSAVRLGLIGDTLWIRNLTPPRISRFLTNGAHVGTEQVRVDVDYQTSMGVQGVTGYLRDGRAWTVPDGFVVPVSGGEATAPFMIGSRSMAERSTLFSWRAGRGRLAGTQFEPIAEPPFFDVAPDGSAILLADWADTEPGALAVRWLQPDGEELRSWRFATPPAQVPQSVRDSLVQAGRNQVAEIRERVIAQGIPEHEAPAVPSAGDVLQAAYLPGYYPPVSAVRAGIDGTTWLLRSHGPMAGHWIVLDPDGSPQFAVALPEGARLRTASREAVWATASDELGVPYVIRWSITAP